MREITNNIYYTGTLNPNMRVFDVIMRTEYGTTYNSYLVKGSEKVALIEATHKDYLENFRENVADVIGDSHIDYLVINHTEPDHTGCIREFLKFYPDIEIICSPAAAIYMKNITNLDNLKLIVVKDGDSISLGDKTLEFINAPFLHWPDSMFTYIKEDKVLFSCDFLGAHYCEPQIFDYRTIYEEAYWDALKYYFDCIFAPFSKYVLSALGKIKDLEIDFACNSHGPVLTKGDKLGKVIELYYKWATPVPRENKLVPIFYCTAYNSTRDLAYKMKEGILNIYPTADIRCYNVIDHDMAELHKLINESDAFLIGALTINRDAVPPLYHLISGIDAINIAKRPAAVFGSFGWSGEGFKNIATRLETIKVNVYPEQFKVNFVPSEKELAQAVIFAETFAKTLD